MGKITRWQDSRIGRAAVSGRHDGELLEFVQAIDRFKRTHERKFLAWSQVFEVIQGLGYRKVEGGSEDGVERGSRN